LEIIQILLLKDLFKQNFYLFIQRRADVPKYAYFPRIWNLIM